ncbi:MAG: FAD-dependent oxidoreductase [Candidatus Nealsonbacteria bacterium]|nr:FAD-dependent oxidoreductase [Candidatus Nealsonbacteria bacterium]
MSKSDSRSHPPAGRREFITRRGFLKSSALGVSGTAGAIAAASGKTSAEDASVEAQQAETYNFTRRVPVESGYDLVVCGGGPAGTAAAVCAARLGAKVLLVEATGCLGGMGTSGLVTAFDPMGDGKRMLVGGFMREVVETMFHRKFLRPGIDPNTWRKNYHQWTQFQAEGYKLVLDEFVTKAGVEVRFFTRVIDADADSQGGKVSGVVLQNIEGYRFIRARAYIDATGDAVLADLCGAACREAGRDTPAPMAATLCSLHAGIDWSRMGNEDVALKKALAAGHFTQPDRHLPGMTRVNQTVGYLNGGHLFRMNALKCQNLSAGVMLGRRIVQEYVDFYRMYVAGCEDIQLVTTGSLIGVRESRRIVGEYELNVDDYLARRQFPDQIAVFNKAVDIHAYDCTEEAYRQYYQEYTKTGRLGKGECFGIPYSILVPKGWKNLWVAGRCNSSDVKVHGSIRVQPAASMMGQAAGTAAVQSLRTDQPANDLDTEQLVQTLRKAGAYLPQKQMSKTMTRA